MPRDLLLESPLAELEVLVVDCQTTGATPTQGSVLELGWCTTRAIDPQGSTTARAHWVVPEGGERISAQVRQLTGFDESVLAEALPAEEAWKRLSGSVGDRLMPTAIHFARFELPFLRDWAARFEPQAPFRIDALCVHAIACKLFPDLPRRNLRALAGFLGHSLHLERRALGHVLATAFIWEKLALELTARGLTHWHQVAPWLLAKEPASTPRKRRYPIAPATYRALPEKPGVYRFLRSNGDLLYVGKATSLRKRVASHFTKQSGATERALEMLTQVSQINVTETATALEAALLESRLIKELDPPYNVQLLAGERDVWFASDDFSRASTEPTDDHRLGPLSSRYSVRALGALLRLSSGEPPSDSLRAASVGAPLRWAPDEASFAAGWLMFSAKHAGAFIDGSPRRRALRVARGLLDVVPEEAEPTADDGPKVWDEARICRHLERAGAQAFRVLRRASWLRLLAESSVAYREPMAKQTRFLLLREATIAEAGELPPGVPLPEPSQRGRSERARAFDAASYDSLRILTTELKRILRDGGEVSVRLSRSRWLSGAPLARILTLV